VNYPIRCVDLSKKFRRVMALDHLNLDVPEGAIYALIGANGAGKTTAIKTMVNIHEPDSGRVEISGRGGESKDSRRLRGRDFESIGYVSENQKMPEWMTVDYLLQYLKPFYPAWDDSAAAALVRKFGLPGDRKLSQLSRGMKMKAALASSLAYHPRLLILDEPFSGLDPLVRDEFIEGLIESAEGTTILISSHDLAEIESFATHVAFLHDGKLLFAEPMESLTARFREVTVTLGSPGEAVREVPKGWLLPEASASVFRFIASNANEDFLEAQVRDVLPQAIAIQAEPMTLRTIFLALVKSNASTERSR